MIKDGLVFLFGDANISEIKGLVEWIEDSIVTTVMIESYVKS